MRNKIFVIAMMAVGTVSLAQASAQSSTAPLSLPRIVEDYVHVPMPPGFRVVMTEMEGPVFADANGRTLYTWPLKRLRNGYAGEAKGKIACTGERTTENAGLMSPYPPGLVLPDLDSRPSCAQMWPPVLAGADAKPIGAWSIVTGKDGRRQWAYNEHPVYTSSFDHAPGDVLGGSAQASKIRDNGEPAVRVPLGPPPNVPPGFAVITTPTGRMLITEKKASVYTFDRDTPARSNCDQTCEQEWIPVSAPDGVQVEGEWSIVERAPGVKQWAFRKKRLYTHALDMEVESQEGSDVPGWHNVYTQLSPLPPKEFTMQETDTGRVLADAHGRTIYIYGCGDDSQDQMACDHPDTTQAYRLTMCGGGDWERCVHNWPYVLAPRNVKSGSRVWGTMDIDPQTGHPAAAGAPGSLHVWTFRDRPVYTFTGDSGPGDTDGDGRGEFDAKRDGFKALWLRDDYFSNAN